MAKDKLDEFYENLDKEYGKSNTDKNVDYVMSLIKQRLLPDGTVDDNILAILVIMREKMFKTRSSREDNRLGNLVVHPHILGLQVYHRNDVACKNVFLIYLHRIDSCPKSVSSNRVNRRTVCYDKHTQGDVPSAESLFLMSLWP